VFTTVFVDFMTMFYTSHSCAVDTAVVRVLVFCSTYLMGMRRRCQLLDPSTSHQLQEKLRQCRQRNRCQQKRFFICWLL